MILKDRKFQIPRIWSNNELKKFAHLFKGKVVNVSAWQDKDKQGRKYKDYFINSSEYYITNYKSEIKGFQGDFKNEIFLDLEQELDKNLLGNFDVVFNHTTLEHVFNVNIAFENLCKLSRDIVIIVVPFLQEYHGGYGDFWRFSPLLIDKLFTLNGLNTVYLNYNNSGKKSVYVFAIGTRKIDKWQNFNEIKGNKLSNLEYPVGNKVVSNTFFYNIELFLRQKIQSLLKFT